MHSRFEFISIIKKRTLGLTFILGAASLAFAQQKTPVSGTVVGAQGATVPYASITFTNGTDKINSDAALTDETGKYSLTLAPGSYSVSIEAIDFKKTTSTLIVTTSAAVKNFDVSTETSVTNNKTQDIEGVVIVAAAPKPYKVELDKRVYDPSSDLISKGGNLQDVLSNVPSISVDTDGTVSMRGNTNIKFLINGKPSALLGIDDGADALKSIPADQIDRIEVITNPSSKYEASGTAGILNIILKKSKKLGFNGSVTGTLGYLPQTSLNTNLSWRKGDWTYFLNGGGGYNRSKSKSIQQYQTLRDAGSLKNFDLISRSRDQQSKGEGNNYNATAGFNVDLTPKASVNASILLRTFDYTSDEATNIFENNFLGADLGGNFDVTTAQQDNGKRTNNSYQVDLGYDQKIGDKGQLLSISGSLQNSNGNNNSTSNINSVSTKTNIINIPTRTITNNLIYSSTDNKTYLGKVDYELPLGEISKIEAGARYDFTKNTYDYTVLQSINNSPQRPLSNFTSNTFYEEKVAAAYAQFKSKIDALGYQLGTRVENTAIDIDFKNNGTGDRVQKTKSYTGFFPSVFLSYDLGKNSQFLINYSRRIQRPRSFFLVPFNSYDTRSSFQGNPDLNPTYENSFEFGYSLSSKKLTFNPTLYYKKSQDEVNFVQVPVKGADGITAIFTQPVNAGSEENYGLDLNGSYDPYKWFRLMGSVNLYGYKTTGSFQDFNFAGNGFSSRIRLTTTFKPDKDTSFQFQGSYRGAEKSLSNNRKPTYVINFGASRTIMKGDGTLAFNIQDIFNTRAREFTTTGADFTQYNYNQFQPRQFSVSFTYRFKQGEKIDQQKQKKDINNDYSGDQDQDPM
ncbi:TonB-dependent receptor [Halpernia frigidisoli]|uniref:Outer membrane receptor proteins, mostly Fe transport n=1 Tax=Halpernia frigidisoli TaxID=1125876 RepID=A0A1I3E225_9FLAO|nr:TonB-dependent receptor [Halpernia frigidisoli]SFH92943.1 Outer membrane receptor proteins, mostly Fe transport [Halpernia frigidisoli]